MMTNNPNANLIEAMKEKLPLKGQLADMLMDTLYIGKEAVYRRLRGEVPFTLQESALISRKLGISLDKIIGLSFKSNAMFNIIAVRLNSTTIKIVCSTADFPRSSIFFSFPSPPNQKVMDLEVTPRRISTPFPSPFQDY